MLLHSRVYDIRGVHVYFCIHLKIQIITHIIAGVQLGLHKRYPLGTPDTRQSPFDTQTLTFVK